MHDYIALSLIKTRHHDIRVQAEHDRLVASAERQRNPIRLRLRRLSRQR